MHVMRSVSSALGVRFARINFGHVIGDLGPRGSAVPPTRFSTTESGAAGSWSGSDSTELLRDLTKDERYALVHIYHGQVASSSSTAIAAAASVAANVNFPQCLSLIVRRVGERTNTMWKEHVALKTSFPEASLPPGVSSGAMPSDTVRRKRLIYRSKQRGWLEVDLLLGTWSEQNVPSLTAEEMDSYEDILNLETLDIFAFVTGNEIPPAFVDTPMMARLRKYVKSNPLGQTPETYAMAKRTNNLT